jgi:hypothetical protein
VGKPNNGIDEGRKKRGSMMRRINKSFSSKKNRDTNPKNWNEWKEEKRNI